MKVVNDHIEKHLSLLFKDHSQDFDQILEYLNVSSDSEIRLLNYINQILDSELDFEGSTLKFTHLHFPSFSSSLMLKILQFLAVKFYFKGFDRSETNTNGEACFFRHQIEVLKKRDSFPITLGIQSGKKSEQRQRAQKRAFRKLRKFYTELVDKDNRYHQVPIPRTLISTFKVQVDGFLQSNDEIQWAAKPVDSVSVKLDSWDVTESSYVALNSEFGFDNLDKKQIGPDTYLLEEIENVILFDSDSRSINKNFNYSHLSHSNEHWQTQFKNLLIMSFGNEPFRIGLESGRIFRVLSNYFRRPDKQSFESYVVTQLEKDLLFKEQKRHPINVELLGAESEFYNDFIGLVGEYEGLRELISIKLRNIYSLCFNEEIKTLILNSLFENTSTYGLITEVTTSELGIIPSNTQSAIRNTLDNLLSVVIGLQLGSRIKEMNVTPCIIIPSSIIENKDFIYELKQFFGTGVKFTTWKDINLDEKREVVFLEYRDTGFRDFNIYPNLIETRFFETDPTGLFLSFFFKKNFQHNQYSYYHFLVDSLLEHPFRHQNFNWNSLKNEIKLIKPEIDSQDHLWDLDNEYEGTSEYYSVVIEYERDYCKRFYPTQLLVLKRKDDLHLQTIRAEELIEFDDYSDISVQTLESLFEDLNLFRITEEEEMEIKKLKEDHGIPANQVETRLWKELLRRKANSETPSQVFSDLSSLAKGIKAQMVSNGYFENEWLEPQSNSLIPRNKRMFKVICNYLNLPEVYFRVMLKKRAREKRLTRISNSKMNRLFIQLIEYGLFDDPPVESSSEFWREVASVNDLEEIGITSANRDMELSALVDLARPNLDLERITSAQIQHS